MTAPGEGDLTPQTRLRTGDLVDELSTPEGTVVMVRRGSASTVARLSLLGREVLAAVGTGLTLAELASQLRRRLGEPASGDPLRLVHAAVLDLLEAGVLVVDEA